MRDELFKSAGRYWIWLLVFLAGAAVGILWLDGPLAVWMLDWDAPRQVQKLLMLAEFFGHGIGIPFIFAAVWLMDPRGRAGVPRLIALSWGSGLLADCFKILVARPRPRDFHLLAGGGPGAFGDWFPGLELGSRWQSFPSGHTAVAVGLAFGLSAMYPRGRWLFATMAVLVACQRAEESAHYLSDLLFGAAVAAGVAAVLLHGPAGRFCDRREQAWLGE